MTSKQRRQSTRVSQGQQHCHFLALPPEIRELILDFSLQPSKWTAYIGRRESWNDIEHQKAAIRPCPSILLACRQIHRECLHILQAGHRTPFVLHLREGMQSLPLSLSYRKSIRRLNVAVLAKRSRRSGLEVYIPMLLGRLTSQMKTTFPGLHGITLTICILFPKSPSGYYNCPTCVLPSLVMDSFWSVKITGVNLQMGPHYTSKVCQLARDSPHEALKREFGWLYELSGVSRVDLYCHTALSDASYNTWVAAPGELIAHGQRVQSESSRITQLLRMERNAVTALVRTLPILFPQLPVSIYRKSGWRASVVSYDILDLDEAEETVVPQLMRDRTIGA